MMTFTLARQLTDSWLRFFSAATISLVLLLFLLLALIAGCQSDGSGGNDHHNADDDTADGEVDDCGFTIVKVPDGCDKCHGAPPNSARHPENNRCYRCHGNVIAQDFAWVQEKLHNNGTVDYAVGCTSCHGWNQGVSPPQNLRGQCSVDQPGVGAHAAMRNATLPVHQVACTNCHTVPLNTWAAGHIDGDKKAEVTFANLAILDGAHPVFDGKKCTSVYCHGATLTGGTLTEPSWTDTSHAASRCGACHRLTDPQGNTDVDCHSCHPTTVDESGAILPRGTHINGYVDGTADQKKKTGGAR